MMDGHTCHASALDLQADVSRGLVQYVSYGTEEDFAIDLASANSSYFMKSQSPSEVGAQQVT